MCHARMLKLLPKYPVAVLCLTVICSVFSFLAHASERVGYVDNPQFARTRYADDLFDGINSNGQVQVFSADLEIMIDGTMPSRKPFGASPVWKDVTGDGQPELVVGDGRGYLWIFPVTSARNAFPPRVSHGRFVHAQFGAGMNIDVADYNNDGINDVIVGTPEGAIQIVLNRGNARFIPATGPTPAFPSIDVNRLRTRQSVDTTRSFPLVMQGQLPLVVGSFVAPRYVDWTGNGVRDLLVGEGSYSANSVYLFRNTGSNHSPEFRPQHRHWLAYGIGREHLSPAVADLTGNGRLDLLVGTRTGHLYFYENRPHTEESDTPFLLHLHPSPMPIGGETVPAGEIVRPYLADVNNNGLYDLLLGAPCGRVYISRNSGTRQQFRFEKPVPIHGVDVRPRARVPDGRWIVYPRHHMNAAVIMRAMEEEGRTFARVSFVDDYTAGDAGMMLEDGVVIPFERRFEITFLVRGRGIEVMSELRQAGEQVLVGDIRETRFGGGAQHSFTLTEQWNRQRYTFSLPRLTEASRDEENTWVHVAFVLNNVQRGAYFDVTDIQIRPL